MSFTASCSSRCPRPAAGAKLVVTIAWPSLTVRTVQRSSSSPPSNPSSNKTFNAAPLGAIDSASLFINSRSRLLADLDRRPAPLPPGPREFRHLAANDLAVEDEYGSYPVYAPLCHESFWKVAVDIFLNRADVVLLDLSGYHWDNMGTGYELQRVIDHFPIERTILLADSTHTDRPFLQAQIQRAWSQMAAGSPNAGNEPRRVIVAQADDPSRAVAASLQDRLAAKPPALLKTKD